MISGNGDSGIYIDGAPNTTVSGNFIGTDASGQADLHNFEHGIHIPTGAASISIPPSGTLRTSSPSISGMASA